MLVEALPTIVTMDDEPASGPGEPGLLFEGHLRPFTEPVTFIEAPFDIVAAEFRAWLAGIAGMSNTFTPLREPLRPMLLRLEPYAFSSWKRLLVETAAGWTAVFAQGDDTESGSSVVATRLEVRWLTTHHSRHVVREGRVRYYGDRRFSLHYDRWNKVRSVQASQQGRWQWHEFGEPEPFEDLAAYTARRIPDRLTLESLNRYCEALGIRRSDPDFYRPRGVLIEQDISHRERQPLTQTGQQWRDQYL